MKKIIVLFIISLAVIATPALALAQGSGQGQQVGGQQRIQDPDTHEDEDDDSDVDETDEADEIDSTEMQGIGKAVKSLTRVTNRNNNPGIGEQIRAMVQNQEQVQVQTQTAVQNMSKRGKLMKFLIGPDYKNAGQVRSNLVHLRNDINQLQNLKENLWGTDAEDVQAAIDELQAESDNLDSQLEERLSGFSLFGWLAKRFAE